ncbi:MAG: prolyl oligopeptidase family serine peptidase [Bacteroidota bacterium]
MKFLLPLLPVILSTGLFAQTKKVLTPDEMDSWSQVKGVQMSGDGSLISYQVTPGVGDQTLKVVSDEGDELLTYERGEDANVSWDGKHVIFKIVPARDTVRALQRVKTKKGKMPQDSLGVYHTGSGQLQKIAPVKDVKVPKEWSGFIAYRLDEIRSAAKENNADTLKQKGKAPIRKVGKDNGFHLVVHNLISQATDTFKYVTNYLFAEEQASILFESKGVDSTFLAGVYHYDLLTKNITSLMTGEHTYAQHAIAKDGSQVAFLVDTDTTKVQIRDYKFMYWNRSLGAAEEKVSHVSLPDDWIVSQHGKVRFSKTGKQVHFGTAPVPLVQDTTLLEDEIIQVEVWNYQDGRLMTQQEYNKKDDLKKNYLAAFLPATDEVVQIADETTDDVSFIDDDNPNAHWMLCKNDKPYARNVSWEGFPPRKDVYVFNVKTGEKKEIEKGLRGQERLSLFGNYVLSYDVEDSVWYSHNIVTERKVDLSQAIPTRLFDEEDDHPDFPRPYGVAGWTTNDSHVLIYDRYDIWKVDPDGKEKPVNLTKGRAANIQYRVVTLDEENPVIDLKNAVVSTFNEQTKATGFGSLNEARPVKMHYQGDFKLDKLKKAKNSDRVIFTRATNLEFPDLQASDLTFKKITRLSDANPQQSEYNWSTVELMSWTSLQGTRLDGLLYKPEDFDPNKKYPMIVYFYERNADRLHVYHGAFPHRSVIRPSYYASRGYIVFIPDIVYRDGYPGKSCYDAVIPGVTHLVNEGYIDEARIGVQGHSWGGYQAAYLITQTDLFKCAEAGAPVANMISAYGGIRWGSGMSRMFQYEHTQSRIGGTLWEYPFRYIENSPIFYVDKINTPLLIMHNDKDGAVPWYQGIELFVAMRRLNKTAWMLNYNDEPHWPTKRENIKDFQVRMQQYFDHYLMGQPMPEWMDRGIPAIEKGINRGY